MKRFTEATQAHSLLHSPKFQAAKRELMAAIQEASNQVKEIKVSSAEVREEYLKTIQEFNRDRGRDLYYPFLSSGLGSGPYVELLDGSVKLDMITGIGVNFFGHSHPEFVSEMIDGLSADVMQGNLQPGVEAKVLLRKLLSKVGNECRLKQAWLTTCGTMANETALKIARQKKYPATKVFAFNDCFAGRSTAMQEITDNPKYRDGQPIYGEVAYLPFYDAKIGLEASIEATLSRMKSELARYPGKFCAIVCELVQGEGGFNFAPSDFYVRIFEEAKIANLAVWIDEVQSFGRTGELFAYQTFQLEKYVDIVTIGKMLQACVVLYSEEFNPRPGLVAGTFSGSTVALRTARRTLEMLDEQGFLGSQGKIKQFENYFKVNLDKISQGTCKGIIGEIRVIGAMIAFAPFNSTQDDVKGVLLRLFDHGLVAFNCGHGPYLVRMLAPYGAMNESDIDNVCAIIEKSLLEVAEERK